jgi:hypothetical protein
MEESKRLGKMSSMSVFESAPGSTTEQFGRPRKHHGEIRRINDLFKKEFDFIEDHHRTAQWAGVYLDTTLLCSSTDILCFLTRVLISNFSLQANLLMLNTLSPCFDNGIARISVSIIAESGEVNVHEHGQS